MVPPERPEFPFAELRNEIESALTPWGSDEESEYFRLRFQEALMEELKSYTRLRIWPWEESAEAQLKRWLNVHFPGLEDVRTISEIEATLKSILQKIKEENDRRKT